MRPSAYIQASPAAVTTAAGSRRLDGRSRPRPRAVAQASGGHLTTRYVLRDEHPELMDQYLTGGGKAILAGVRQARAIRRQP